MNSVDHGPAQRAQREATIKAGEAVAEEQRRQFEIKQKEEQEKQERLQECVAEFSAFNESSLSKKKDKELAAFQAEYPNGSPQHSLALHEWNRRLIARQSRVALFGVILSGLFGILGILLGWFLASSSHKNIPDSFSPVAPIEDNQKIASEDHKEKIDGNDPKKVPVNTK